MEVTGTINKQKFSIDVQVIQRNLITSGWGWGRGIGEVVPDNGKQSKMGLAEKLNASGTPGTRRQKI